MRSGRISSVLVVHATRALHYRMPTTPATSDDVSTTALGAWYATRLPWSALPPCTPDGTKPR
jgi:hypothetical protein